MVNDKAEAADRALKEHMVDMMDKREAECVVLVSDDSGFIGVLREAKERCLKTVVVGDENDGALKRVADVGFSWKEILMGKAKNEVEKVVGRWKDRDVLKRLEWTYDPVVEKEKMNMERGFCRIWGFQFDDYEDDEIENVSGFDFAEKGGGGAWWEMNDDGVSCRDSDEDGEEEEEEEEERSQVQ